jgi:large subunit ribosomal protein L19
MHHIIKTVEQKYLRNDLPKFNVGDTVRVHFTITETNKTRTQVFEGIVLAKKHGGVRETFIVRKISFNGIGVERIFPLHSPLIKKIEIKRRGRVRRAKIYYMRKRIGKAAMKVKEKMAKK